MHAMLLGSPHVELICPCMLFFRNPTGGNINMHTLLWGSPHVEIIICTCCFSGSLRAKRIICSCCFSETPRAEILIYTSFFSGSPRAEDHLVGPDCFSPEELADLHAHLIRSPPPLYWPAKGTARAI